MTVEVIRTDGTREHHVVAAGDLRAVRALIGCDTIDTVTLSRDAKGPRQIMLVDDNGYETVCVARDPRGQIVPALDQPFVVDIQPVRARKPVNVEATKLYHAVCRPGTTHQIVGDVAILDDQEMS
jgi:hypothetical protein